LYPLSFVEIYVKKRQRCLLLYQHQDGRCAVELTSFFVWQVVVESRWMVIENKLRRECGRTIAEFCGVKKGVSIDTSSDSSHLVLNNNRSAVMKLSEPLAADQ